MSEVVARSGNPAWKKGVSGNPGGRPKNPLAQMVRDKTKNGEEIIERVYAIFSLGAPEKNYKAIMWAAEFLRDMGWHKISLGLTDEENSVFQAEKGTDLKPKIDRDFTKGNLEKMAEALKGWKVGNESKIESVKEEEKDMGYLDPGGILEVKKNV